MGRVVEAAKWRKHGAGIVQDRGFLERTIVQPTLHPSTWLSAVLRVDAIDPIRDFSFCSLHLTSGSEGCPEAAELREYRRRV